MPGQLSGNQRFQLWASVALTCLALRLLFGQPQPQPTISAWQDDPAKAAQGSRAELSTSRPAIFNRHDPQEQVEGTPTVARATVPTPTANEQRAALPATDTRNAVLAALAHQDQPWGNPTGSRWAVLTQGYGVGTHAPAAIWGGVDLAIDGTGDGESDPAVTWHAPVYATMRGVVELKPNSAPAGNHVWIKNERYKVGYGHLQSFAVKHGQVVRRGDLIGYIGATGHATGPHLHYHIWEDGVNVNPLNFGALP